MLNAMCSYALQYHQLGSKASHLQWKIHAVLDKQETRRAYGTADTSDPSALGPSMSNIAHDQQPSNPLVSPYL